MLWKWLALKELKQKRSEIDATLLCYSWRQLIWGASFENHIPVWQLIHSPVVVGVVDVVEVTMCNGTEPTQPIKDKNRV